MRVILFMLVSSTAMAQPALIRVSPSQGETQRSYLRYVDLECDTSIGLSNIVANSSRLRVTRQNPVTLEEHPVRQPLMSVIGTTIRLDYGPDGIGSQYVFNINVGGNGNSPIGNGRYSVSIDADGDGNFGQVFHFHRLLGDVTGNRIVDAADKSQVLAAQGKPYNAESDVNGDGLVNVVDTSLVTRNFGQFVAL